METPDVGEIPRGLRASSFHFLATNPRSYAQDCSERVAGSKLDRLLRAANRFAQNRSENNDPDPYDLPRA